MADLISEIVVVLDRSGSMGRLRNDTIGGFNTLIEDQRKENTSKCLVTLVQFDDQYEVNYMAKPVEEVEPLDHSTYQPRGMTALHDAIGKTINGITNRHSALSEEETPGQVMFVIITDGIENSSEEFKGQAREMILKQEAWDFIYLGADISEEKIAKDYGIALETVSNYSNTSKGVASTYGSTSRLMNQSRDLYSKGASRSRRSLSNVSTDVDWKGGIEGSELKLDAEEEK